MNEEDPLIEVNISETPSVPPNEPIDFFDISGGFIDTVNVVPTNIPKKLAEQILIYSNGGTYRLYIYDTVNNAWRYATLT